MEQQAPLDACPGILTLHPARDGHVARIRLPGGYVTRRQWNALATLAADFGDGCLDLTARGNVQLRGLRPTAAAELARRATGAGLLPSGAHDRSRNITASPLAGLPGHPPLRRLVSALDAALIADQQLAALPGRFLCAVDDGAGGAALTDSDLGLRRSGGRVELFVAGRPAGVTVPVRAAVPAVLTAARAAIALGIGSDVTRIRDLPDGGASVAAAIGGSLGPPAPADDGRLPLGIIAGTFTAARTAAASGAVVVSNGAPASEPAAGPALPDDPAADSFSGSAAAWDDAVAVVAAPLGRLTGAQTASIGGLLRFGEVIRLAPAGRLVLPLSVPPDAQANRISIARLADAGLLTSDDDDLAGVTACSGLACARAVADVRAAARPLPGHPRTHWVGCPRGCGKPRDAESVTAAGPDTYLVPGQHEPRSLAQLTSFNLSAGTS
jgi:precorrin-3B synthase